MASSKEQYNYFYNRLYPLLRDGKIDFAQVASRTGFKERKIRETLMFRLTAGEVRQLFGKKDDQCYLCSTAMSGSKEPLCLPCLQALDTCVHEIHLHAPSVPPKSREEGHPEPQSSQSDAVPRSEYEALKRELSQYKSGGGGSEPSDIDQQIAERMHNPSANRARYKAISPQHTAESVLNILKLDGDDLPMEDIDFEEAIQARNVPIRQFGFQRLKSRH